MREIFANHITHKGANLQNIKELLQLNTKNYELILKMS